MKITVDSRRKNVLPNTYIPVLSKKVLGNILSRLPTNSIVQLSLLWPRLVHTQPHLEGDEKNKHNQRLLNKRIIQEIKNSYTPPSVPAGSSNSSTSAAAWRLPVKRKLVDKLLYEYWTKGLNLLQISQIDCQLIVDRPNAYYWISSTVKDRGGLGNEVPISLDPQRFLNELASDLNTMYMTYIYVCRHPTYPLVIIRIQVFDLQPISSSTLSSKASHNSNPHITSHKPYFLAIPLNSPHIIHSPGQSVVSKIVLQAVERNLSQDPTNILSLQTDENQKPVRSLESMHILKGNSRFGGSLGAWTPYADGTVDALPLDEVESHKLIEKEMALQDDAENGEDEMQKLKKIANLRFKGSEDGRFKSDRFYDDVKPISKRRKKFGGAVSFNNIEDREEVNDGYEEVQNSERTEFSSIAPVQYVDFTLQDTILDLQEESSGIVLKLSGSDVFAGLHELSVQTTERDSMILNPELVPGWLTGEEGASSGTVKNGSFLKS
ncbi:inner kinetochore subunit Chl4p [[Candida] railenensis]|uniref:Inner kinetochore subunit Chl4p n=1 Tax=[Candida] railenensis TaxID=45579 RepID=A0A9P0QW39_9ASCO|nr:inner kinetochore subunit Chl4p [[Candida] railenensis]